MLKATKYLKEKIQNRNLFVPKVAVLLESGIGKITDDMIVQLECSYSDIPGLETTSTEEHNGRYIIGEVGNHEVIAMDGRVHYYESGCASDITKHIRVLNELGCKNLVTTDVVGALDPQYEIGDVFIVDDHINLMPTNPLIDRNTRKVHFLDQTNIYNEEFIQKAEDICKKNHISYNKGVYASMSGPSYETPAEAQMLNNIGADVVGMATVPESTEAHRCNMNVLSICLITNLASKYKDAKLTHNDIVKSVEHNKYDLYTILREFTDHII